MSIDYKEFEKLKEFVKQQEQQTVKYKILKQYFIEIQEDDYQNVFIVLPKQYDIGSINIDIHYSEHIDLPVVCRKNLFNNIKAPEWN